MWFSGRIARTTMLGDTTKATTGVTMKKAIAAASAAFLMGAGLVSASGTAAVANDDENPYVGTIKTNVRTSGPFRVRPGEFARVKVRVNRAGNGNKPLGTLRIIVRKAGSGVVRTKTATYRGTPRTIRTGKLRQKGRYKVIIKYTPRGANSVFQKSRGLKLLRVR